VPLIATAGPADAATCAAVKVTGAFGSIALSPSAVTIKVGGCVKFTNATTSPPPFDTVSITVGSVSHGGVAQGGSTTFSESRAGKFAVTARQSTSGASASGQVTVTAASPSPTPRPTPSHTATPHPSPTPTISPVPNQSTGPVVATRPPPAAHSPSVAPSATPGGSFISGTTTPTPTPSATILSGPLQPASGRGVGLPAALAALFVIGSGGGLLRVLLAVPAQTDAGQAAD
jgi:plastocyanin